MTATGRSAIFSSKSRAWQDARWNCALGLVLAVTAIAVCIVNPQFASIENARDLLVQIAPVVIVGCGMTVVIMVGEIDISVGSVFGFLAAVMGLASYLSIGGFRRPWSWR